MWVEAYICTMNRSWPTLTHWLPIPFKLKMHLDVLTSAIWIHRKVAVSTDLDLLCRWIFVASLTERQYCERFHVILTELLFCQIDDSDCKPYPLVKTLGQFDYADRNSDEHSSVESKWIGMGSAWITMPLALVVIVLLSFISLESEECWLILHHKLIITPDCGFHLQLFIAVANFDYQLLSWLL